MKVMSIAEFHVALKAQGVSRREDIAFKCPICKTVHSMQSLINAGAGKSDAEVEKFAGFSCVGRFTNAGPYRAETGPGKGCDWTLGGLFQVHELTVIDEDGKPHPRFDIASEFEAQALAIANMIEGGDHA